MADEDSEQTLSIIRKCFVYRLPVRQLSSTVKAADWDLPNPMWIGRLKIVAVGEHCKILLEENTGELFATCPVGPGAIEQVNDSSRYYVVRIVNEQGKHAFIGLGFAEKEEAFEFSSTLSDHAQFVKAKKESAQRAHTPSKDYSLPQGSTITVNLKIGSSTTSAKPKVSVGSSGGIGLAPPPAPKHSLHGRSGSEVTSTSSAVVDPFGFSSTPSTTTSSSSSGDIFGAFSSGTTTTTPSTTFTQSNDPFSSFLSGPSTSTTPSSTSSGSNWVGFSNNDPFAAFSQPQQSQPQQQQGLNNWPF